MRDAINRRHGRGIPLIIVHPRYHCVLMRRKGVTFSVGAQWHIPISCPTQSPLLRVEKDGPPVVQGGC